MTLPPAIEVRDLCKKFARNQDQHRHYALRDVFRELIGRRPDPTHLRRDEFLAVNRLSFDVAPGEAVALIGENGCGKTTTLRMIAGIIKPDAGTITVRGRVQALIALGAGFNPRLCGRENIRNNAAIMGFSSRQTRRIMQEVIDFADIGEFIDSPVSTYSSGMKARLGFSVAVHLEPDILISDEILGVGDFAFQNKCFSRINVMREQGVSILLVSHSHQRIQQLCDRAIWLKSGHLQLDGDPSDVVGSYLESLHLREEQRLKTRPISDPAGSGYESAASQTSAPTEPVRMGENIHGKLIYNGHWIDSVGMSVNGENRSPSRLRIHDSLEIALVIKLKQPAASLRIGFVITRSSGERVAVMTTDEEGLSFRGLQRFSLTVRLSDVNLRAGSYVLTVPIQQGPALEFIYRQQMYEFLVSGDSNPNLGYLKLRNTMSIQTNGLRGI